MTVSDPLVDFLVIGAMKAGTTWIDEMLRVATESLLPRNTKETFFFDQRWDRGLGWYRKQFPTCDHVRDRPTGEVASTYYASPDAAKRAAATVPGAHVLAVLREPGDRAWSHYRHLIRMGELDDAIPFVRACRTRPELIRFSSYDECLTPWREKFGNALAILQFESLPLSPPHFAEQVARAIAVDVDLTAVPGDKRYEERAPRFRHLARIAHRCSARLHGRGLHRVVEASKRLGLDRLVERHAVSDDGRSESRAYVRDVVARDVAALRSWSDIDLTLWHD